MGELDSPKARHVLSGRTVRLAKGSSLISEGNDRSYAIISSSKSYMGRI